MEYLDILYQSFLNIDEDSIEFETKKRKYGGIIIAVAHDQFTQGGIEKISTYGKDKHVLYDLKYVLKKDSVDMRL